jgi:ABC-type sugar transport system permease subunit/ABC-type glycerol-3-phosphate transport system substrate-binding protein
MKFRFDLKIVLILGILISILLGIFIEKSNKPDIKEGETEISIVIDAGPRDMVFWNEMKKSFEEDNPGIRLRLIKNMQEEKIMTMIAGGVAPDVILFQGDRFLAFLTADALYDITEWVKRDSSEIDLGDIYPITLKPFTMNNRLFGMPFSICPFIMFYNRDLFQKHNVPFPDTGWTWEDMRKAAKKLTHDIDRDGVIDEFGLAMNLWIEPLFSFIYQNGGKIISGDGKELAMDDPKTIEAVQFIYDLIHKDMVVQTSFNRSKSRATFKDGKTAMLSPGGIFWLPEFRFYENLDFDLAPLPKGPDGSASTISPIGYGIYSHSKHPKEAYKFLKYLASKKGQQILARAGLFISCRKSINHSDAFLKPIDPKTGKEFKYPKHLYNAIKDIEEGKGKLVEYVSLRWWLVQNLINDEFNDLFYNPERKDKTPELVCKEVTRKGNEIIRAAYKEMEGEKVPWSLILGLIAILVIAIAGFILYRGYKSTKASRLKRYDNKWGYALISPWILGFIIFLLGPILVSIFLSFCKWSALNPPEFARFTGLDNYKEIFTNDPKFIKSLLVTSYYTFLAVPLGLIAGILLALLMNVKIKGIELFRVIYFLPAILPSMAVTVLWSSIFRKDGILNYIFLSLYNSTFGLIFGPTNYKMAPDWLADANFTIPALVIMSLWAVGGGMMVYLAGLQGISPDLYEAAEIDGASVWKKFWKITLPQLSPVIFFNLIMGIIGSFQVFNQAYILFSMSGGTGASYGGPEDSALFYVLQLYHKAFKEFQVGYASSLAWILFIIILFFTLLVFKSSPMWVYYEGQKEK